ncbi:MAG: AI-2E family transporter [Oscillospiraceae bacterium]|jgi:predicted PurR-regulated permease PerM|nr:AI-2E family transporter [Oscillospiraceae bacterium]MBQ1790024.1 AI-2E family transporter [Oscillospiraceae bacterium]MBQ4016883.1 AI-2E family transporter [Oscillospiraceae bacterium]
MKRHFKWDRTYINWGMTAFCVVALSLLFYFAVRNISVFGDFFRKLVTILAPFIWGLVICYLLSPLMRFLEERVFLPLGKRLYRKNKKGGAGKFARVMSILFSEIVLLLLIAALVYLIIPQILSSVQMLVQNSGTYADNVSKWLDGLLKNYPELDSYVGGLFGNINANVGNWLETRLLPQLGSLITSVSSGVYGFARSIYNLIIGIIVSVYLLADKEGFLAAVKRLSYAVFSVETADKLRQGLNFVDKTFMGFLSGKILDSLIIGIICYIVCSILKMPYTLLVSVIIGVTNIIPFFGPLIGAIPSALIILMVDPSKCLIFVIFIIILQQIDGNIIGPRILGSSTGINGFWVMFAIILGSGLFGFWGMLLGVPVFVVIYTVIQNLIIKKLKKSDLPWKIADYKEMDYIDPATLQVVKKASVRKEEIAREKALLKSRQEPPKD